MAIQFAYQVHAASPATSIFWVRSSTEATFEESYRSIADTLALPRRHESGVNVLALVRDWLQRKDVSPWLMIVDNADDVEILFSKISNSKMIFRVPIIEEEQALLLLKNKLGQDIDEAVALRLVHTLNYIPLAVNQAAAYIYKQRPQVTVKSYVDEFKRSEKKKDTLLRSDRGDIRRYDGISNSVIIT
ncbi:hypothetical protein EsH8_III_000281 [Colletotrichum jinshuiense]